MLTYDMLVYAEEHLWHLKKIHKIGKGGGQATGMADS